jgi:outer membrane lipoprotein-sorting protein
MPSAAPSARAAVLPAAAAAVLAAILAAFLAVPLSASAQQRQSAQARQRAARIEAALAGLSGRYQGLESLTADYTRITRTPSTDPFFRNEASQTASGVLHWAAESKLRLDQAAPDQQLLTTDGSSAWWYIPEERQVHVFRDINFAGELAPLLTFMAGLEALKEGFLIGEAEGDDVREGQIGLALVSRTPRPDGRDPARLMIYCDPEHRLTGFRLDSPTGEKTDFNLSGIRTNPGFKDGFFAFKPPRGVRVIEESEG